MRPSLTTFLIPLIIVAEAGCATTRLPSEREVLELLKARGIKDVWHLDIEGEGREEAVASAFHGRLESGPHFCETVVTTMVLERVSPGSIAVREASSKRMAVIDSCGGASSDDFRPVTGEVSPSLLVESLDELAAYGACDPNCASDVSARLSATDASVRQGLREASGKTFWGAERVSPSKLRLSFLVRTLAPDILSCDVSTAGSAATYDCFRDSGPDVVR